MFDSSGEPAGHPDFSDSCARGFSGTEFEVGHTSCEDGVSATVHVSMSLCRSVCAEKRAQNLDPIVTS